MTEEMRKFNIIANLCWALLGLWALVILMVAIALVTVPTKAHAFEDHLWGPPAKTKPVKRYKPPVKAWRREEGWPVHPSKPPQPKPSMQELALGSNRCDFPVVVVGSQRVTESEAEDSAQKAWMEEVRFSLGEAYMGIDNAKDYARMCSRSSIGEVLNQTMHRCRVVAIPCRPALVTGAPKQ